MKGFIINFNLSSDVSSHRPAQWFLAVLFAVVLGVFLFGIALAVEQTEKDKRVRIVADHMVADTQNRVAEFSGNVRAAGTDFVITSELLKIFYKEGAVTGNVTVKKEQSVNKIIASGKVNINFDNRVAVGDHAVYTANDGLLVLTGKNATITSNKNSISGEKITLHRHDGRVFVESGSEKRVEVVLEDKGEDSVSAD